MITMTQAEYDNYKQQVANNLTSGDISKSRELIKVFHNLEALGDINAKFLKDYQCNIVLNVFDINFNPMNIPSFVGGIWSPEETERRRRDKVENLDGHCISVNGTSLISPVRPEGIDTQIKKTSADCGAWAFFKRSDFDVPKTLYLSVIWNYERGIVKKCLFLGWRALLPYLNDAPIDVFDSTRWRADYSHLEIWAKKKGLEHLVLIKNRVF